jgi:hypothetical protein
MPRREYRIVAADEQGYRAGILHGDAYTPIPWTAPPPVPLVDLAAPDQKVNVNPVAEETPQVDTNRL